MANVKLNQAYFNGLHLRIDGSLDKFNRQLLKEMKPKIPLGKGIDYEPKYGGKGKRDKRHLRNTGRIMKSEDGQGGGVIFESDHAIFVEVGHKVGGAVKHGGQVKGLHFMLNTLEDHREEIENGSILKLSDDE